MPRQETAASRAAAQEASPAAVNDDEEGGPGEGKNMSLGGGEAQGSGPAVFDKENFAREGESEGGVALQATAPTGGGAARRVGGGQNTKALQVMSPRSLLCRLLYRMLEHRGVHVGSRTADVEHRTRHEC